MSPIDRELERALTDRATGLVPPGDLLAGVEREARGLRRRRGALTGAAALSVLAVAVAVPLATRDSGRTDPGLGFASREPSAASSPSSSPSPSTPHRAVLGWPARGSETDVDAVTDRANRAWAQDHAATTAYEPLWRTGLPDGRVLVAFEAIEPSRSFAVFYVEDGDGTDGRIVQGLEVVDRNPQAPAEGRQSQTRLAQVSAYVDGDQDFVAILGAPTTGQLEWSTDGRRYTSVETVDGTAVIAVTKGEDRTAYRVRVYDGNGVVVYDGPIDLLSED